MNKANKKIKNYVPDHKNVKLQKKIDETFEIPAHLQVKGDESYMKLILTSIYMLKDNFLMILVLIFVFSIITFISDILINKLFAFNIFNFSENTEFSHIIIAIIGFNLSIFIPAPLFLSFGSIFLRIWDGYEVGFTDIFFGFTKILDSYKIMFFWLAKAIITFLPLYILLVAYSLLDKYLEIPLLKIVPIQTVELTLSAIIPFFISFIFALIRYKAIRIIFPLYLVAAFIKADDEYHSFSWREITHVNYLKLKKYAHKLNFLFLFFLVYLIFIFYSHNAFTSQEAKLLQSTGGVATIIAINISSYIILNLFLIIIGTSFAGLYRLNSGLDDDSFWLV